MIVLLWFFIRWLYEGQSRREMMESLVDTNQRIHILQKFIIILRGTLQQQNKPSKCHCQCQARHSNTAMRTDDRPRPNRRRPLPVLPPTLPQQPIRRTRHDYDDVYINMDSIQLPQFGTEL